MLYLQRLINNHMGYMSPEGKPTGGAPENPAPAPTPVEVPPEREWSERRQQFNDPTDLALDLNRENGRLRQTIATLQSNQTTLEGRLPSSSSIVLSTEEAESWTAYQELGTVDVLTASQTELTTLRDETSAMRLDLSVKGIADVLDKPEKDLLFALKQEGARIEAKEENEDDGTKITLYTILTGEGEAEKKYTPSEWLKSLPDGYAVKLASAPTEQPSRQLTPNPKPVPTGSRGEGKKQGSSGDYWSNRKKVKEKQS